MKMLIKAEVDLPKTLQSNNKEEDNLPHFKKSMVNVCVNCRCNVPTHRIRCINCEVK